MDHGAHHGDILRGLEVTARLGEVEAGVADDELPRSTHHPGLQPDRLLRAQPDHGDAAGLLSVQGETVELDVPESRALTVRRLLEGDVHPARAAGRGDRELQLIALRRSEAHTAEL